MWFQPRSDKQFFSMSTIETGESPPVQLLLTTIGYTPPYWDGAVMIILSLTLAIIMAASLIGNAMVIIVVIHFQGMHTKTNMFIVNLAVADFGVAALCMPFSLATIIHGDWIFGDSWCNVNAFFIALFLIASIHGLMYISIHKYFSIVKPLARLITQKRAALMIVASWTAAFVAAIGPIIGWTRNEYKDATAQCGPKFPDNLQEKSHAYFILSVGYAIPLIVLFFNYSVIFRAISRYSVRLHRHSNYDVATILRQQKRITITLFIVFIVFFLCWTPYFVFAGMGTLVGFEHLPRWPNVLVYWCGYASSALNPIIYAFRTKSYRRAFTKLCCCFVTGGLGTDSSPSVLRRLNTSNLSATERTRMRASSMNSTYINSSPSINQRSNILPVQPVENNIGQELNDNGHQCYYGDVNCVDNVFIDDEGEQATPRKEVKKKRSVSESDKEGLAERHFGPVCNRHNKVVQCMSVPVDEDETIL